MGERTLSSGRVALIASALGVLPAQGPVYRERWGHLFLEQRRAELGRELAGRDAEVRQQIAELLAVPTRGLPFLPEARALAQLRGVAADPAFVLRQALGVFPLPEVVDPEAANEQCRNLNASVFLPVTVPDAGVLEFELLLRDAAGAVVWRTVLAKDTAVSDLRLARPAAQVPGQELANGSYELQVVARVDGREPRATDPALRVRCHVLRGYQARAEAAMAAAKAMAAAASELPQALLQGLRAEVERAYHGEAFDVASTAVLDLERLERAVANLREDRHVLAGIEGLVPTMVPGAAGPMRVVLRLSAERHPAAAPTARPLVVFAGGSPAFDLDGVRPAAPLTRSPRWPAAALADFGATLDADVAFVESTGHGRNHGQELAAVIAALRRLWGGPDAPLCLVAEREAATVVGLQAERFVPGLRGLVLVGGAGLALPALERLAGVPVRFARVVGNPADAAQQRLLDHLQRNPEAAGRADVQWLTAAPVPWTCALESLRGPLEAFAAAVLPRANR
ncbi:MAG: hypothetical protein JNK49_15700 [Planctomycetes bacterium]|nr:hypothetical protein [Planctomycetota bacterium]